MDLSSLKMNQKVARGRAEKRARTGTAGHASISDFVPESMAVKQKNGLLRGRQLKGGSCKANPLAGIFSERGKGWQRGQSNDTRVGKRLTYLRAIL